MVTNIQRYCVVHNDVKLRTRPSPTSPPPDRSPLLSVLVQIDIKLYEKYTLLFVFCVRQRTNRRFGVTATSRSRMQV